MFRPRLDPLERRDAPAAFTITLPPALDGRPFTHANAVAWTPDGMLLVAGSNGPAQDGSNDFFLTRVSAAGVLDAGFGAGGVVTEDGGGDDAFRDVRPLPGGGVLAVGASDLRLILARFTDAGTPDPGFGSNGLVAVDLSGVAADVTSVAAVAFHGEGVVAVVARGARPGTPTTPTTPPTGWAVVRVGPDGRPDPGFGTAGVVTEDGFGAAGEGVRTGRPAAGPGGELFLPVHRQQPDRAGGRAFVVRYTPDGRRDGGYGANGVAELTVPVGEFGYSAAPLLAPMAGGAVAALATVDDSDGLTFRQAAVYNRLSTTGVAATGPVLLAGAGLTDPYAAAPLPGDRVVVGGANASSNRITSYVAPAWFVAGPAGDDPVVLPSDAFTGPAYYTAVAARTDGAATTAAAVGSVLTQTTRPGGGPAGITETVAERVVVTTVAVPPPPPVLVGYPQFGVGVSQVTELRDPDQSVRYSVPPPRGTGVVLPRDYRVAAADFTGDGVADLVVGTGPGVATRVRVLDGVDQHELFAVDPFEAAFTGGVYVAAGDLDGDGVADLVVTPDEGGGPRCRVFDGVGVAAGTESVAADFFGIDDPDFRGGARGAIGDVDGDGAGDLIVAAGFQGGPRVAGYSGKSLSSGSPAHAFPDFFAFEPTLRNGVFVAAGDVDGDGKAEVIAGGGPGGGPRVTAFSGSGLLGGQFAPVANFFGGDPESRGGIRVAVKDLDGDAKADVVVGAGEGAGSRVTGYYGKDVSPSGTPPAAFDFDALANGFAGGVFVG